MLAKIAEINGIIGVKQSQYDISQTLQMIRLVGHKISVLTGIDSQFFQVLMIGGRGIFSTAASVMPRQMVAIYDAIQEGNPKKALEIQTNVQILNRFFEYDPGYVAPCKEALTMMGIPVGNARSPLPRLTNEERTSLHTAMERLGLFGD